MKQLYARLRERHAQHRLLDLAAPAALALLLVVVTLAFLSAINRP